MSKATGLAAFTTKKPPAAKAEAEPVAKAAAGPRKRGQGVTVAITTRLQRADWARLRQLADAEGTSLQSLMVDGLTKVLAEHGLPPIRHDGDAS